MKNTHSVNAQLERDFQKKLKTTKAYLHFSDGTIFQGYINLEKDDPRLKDGIIGESAFTTAMAGYQETITDPSYLGQHIIFSTSHIGNYESNNKQMQSDRAHCTSIIGRNFSYNEFFEKYDIPIFSDLDTRKLVKYLVNNNSNHISVITTSEQKPNESLFSNSNLHCNDLERVSWPEPQEIIKGENPIVLIDYGVKQSIVNNLASMNYPLVRLNYKSNLGQILKYNPRMIFLSNGPGDPAEYKDQIEVIKQLLETDIPIRAICLGHQLTSLALGATSEKLPFGHRGVNHPVYDHLDENILITSQNHGYAIDENSLQNVLLNNNANKEFFVSYTSLFDQSIEGLCSTDHMIKTVQFHPEANPGPVDAAVYFQEVKNFLDNGAGEKISLDQVKPKIDIHKSVKKETPYKKILIVGSGPIKIGQASEFDYSGTQACKSLKEIGIDVVLLNSNPATIMTDEEMSYKTYIEPITKETIKKIIEIEKVDAVLSTMGGQTALNLCIELEEDQYLKENNVELLGAKVDTINKTEDRQLFAKELDKLGYSTGKRFQADSASQAMQLAISKVGFPLIIRRDYALGGRGSALVYNQEDLKEVFNTTDMSFPITMEKSLVGYKEVELEVMVDKEKNGVIICSIENIDPCGIHTGDSITVAPAQTISDYCYQKLRTMSLTIAKHMGVVAGGANVQFAINPFDEDDIIVIEMNPRVSRSSALASKATGYPIAKISALLAIGYTLKEILNDITKASPVAFEPTLDYVALKIPIFPFNKFPTSSKVLGPQMRSVGEVLALGANFNETFLKALASLECGLEIPSLKQLKTTPLDLTSDYIRKRLSEKHELSLLTVMEALRMGIAHDEIFELSKIGPWFTSQVQQIVDMEKHLKDKPEILTNPDVLREYKKLGFSDKYLAYLTNCGQSDIFQKRADNNIFPVYKSVDTCSGEFNALTPYFYSCYSEENEANSLNSSNEKSVCILGSGPNRIGQGIEFDYSCVKACNRLKYHNINSVMINSNPETVSTDYDSSDRLYISPLYSEHLFDIFLNENPYGIIASFSGQTGIGIREHIENSFRNEYKKFNFMGPGLDSLNKTEDRYLFSKICEDVELSQTKSMEVRGHKNLLNAMLEIGLPVIIRPSFVIGGESMFIFYSHDDVDDLPTQMKDQLKKGNITFQVENYLENAHEYDVDLVRDKNGNVVFAACEHIEFAGVHSGDSGMITPPIAATDNVLDRMKEISKVLAEKLEIIGPINFQYAVKDEKIYCIEANPRGSRTLPFLSKAYKISLPELATDAMLGLDIEERDLSEASYFAVKQSTFPFDRFIKDNIILGPKMRSTGETMGIDPDRHMAMIKSYLGNYPKLNQMGKVLLSLADNSKKELLPYLKAFHEVGMQLYATEGTAKFIKKTGIPCSTVNKLEENQTNQEIDMMDILTDPELKMVFNTPSDIGKSKSDGEIIRNTAIQFGVPCFTRNENIKSVMECVIGISTGSVTPNALQDLKL